MNANTRLGLLALVAALSACSTLEGDKIDYKSATKGSTLEVPPDLTQLSTDSRYAVPGGGGEKMAEGGINSDAPGISLNLGLQGTPATQAKPAPMQANLVVSTRPAIVLPAALEARAK